MPTIRTRFALEGDKEYKNAVAAINSDLKVLDAEAKNVQARYAGQKDSAEALSETSRVLSEQLEKQREKVDKAREAYEKFKEQSDRAAEAASAQRETIAALREQMEKYGNSFDIIDEETGQYVRTVEDAKAELAAMEDELKQLDSAQSNAAKTANRWETQMLNADTAAVKTEKDLDALTDTQDKSKEKTASLGDAVSALTDKVGVHLPGGLKKALDGVGNLDPKMLAFAGTVGAVTAAAVKLGKALVSMTQDAAASADEILTDSQKYGIASDTLQEWAYAAELVDVSVDTMTGSMTKLVRNMESASEGSASQAEAFAKLGVSVTSNVDGSLRKSEDVFYDVLDALGAMTNETERDATAMAILGKSAQDLNPLINAGRQQLEKYAQEAHNVGYVLSREELEALSDVDDAQQRLTKTWEAAKQKLAVQLAPAITNVVNKLTDFISKLTAVESNGATHFENGIRRIQDKLAPFLDALSAAAGLIKGLTTWDWSTFSTAMGWNISRGQMSYQQQARYRDSGSSWDSSLGSYTGTTSLSEGWRDENGNWISSAMGNAAGTANWRGGYTWVGENGPELAWLPAGSQVVSASESRQQGGDVYYINIDAANVQEFNDIIRIVKNQRVRLRMGV